MLQAPIFNRERHIKYWLRCLKTLLPRGYMPYDANRMMLAAFIVSALDLLSVLDERTTLEERQGYVDWIYSCQHPDGGFRAFNGTDTHVSSQSDREGHTDKRNTWDPANIAGTFFALAALLVLGDNFKRVRRKATLRWLHKLQLQDGSLAEVGNATGSLGDGQDVRFCYLALLVRWILRRDELDSDIPDLDTERLVRFLLASQVLDFCSLDIPDLMTMHRATMAASPKHRTTSLMVRPSPLSWSLQPRDQASALLMRSSWLDLLCRLRTLLAGQAERGGSLGPYPVRTWPFERRAAGSATVVGFSSSELPGRAG